MLTDYEGKLKLNNVKGRTMFWPNIKDSKRKRAFINGQCKCMECLTKGKCLSSIFWQSPSKSAILFPQFCAIDEQLSRQVTKKCFQLSSTKRKWNSHSPSFGEHHFQVHITLVLCCVHQPYLVHGITWKRLNADRLQHE